MVKRILMILFSKIVIGTAVMDYMLHAIRLAKIAQDRNEIPVGAVLVKNNHIIAQAHNACETNHNSLYHAEMLAIHQGIQHLQSMYLNECTLYVTLEPCPMCAAAIAQSRVDKIVFGAYDPKSGGVEHGPKIFEHSHFRPQIIGGVHESQCAELLKKFFQNKRHKTDSRSSIFHGN